jgi:hypothetical protein
VVKTPDGKYQCVTQATPKSKPTITICASDCRYRNIIKHKRIGKKELKIREYIQQGKPDDWIINNVSCTEAYFYRVKKRLEEEGILEKAHIKIEPIEESKTPQTENTSTDIKNVHHGIQTQFKEKSGQIKFKAPIERDYLMLTEYPTVREALTVAITSRKDWWSENTKEIREYIKTWLQKLPQSQIEGLITTLQIVDLHERSRYQKGQSGWPAPLIIASSKPSQYLFDGRYTFKTLFREYGLDLPPGLKPHRVVQRRDQLDELFYHLEEKAFNQLGALETREYLEAQRNQLKAGHLNNYQKTELKAKLLTNPSYQDDPLFHEIKDMLGLK